MEKIRIEMVSIIVLSYNSEATLERCLASIKALVYPEKNFEVIILDNGSEDNTIQIIDLFGFTYFSLPHLNLSELRNYGADIANGEILAFVDSDCVLLPDWLTQIVKWFNDPSVGIVGNEYLLPKDASYFELNWYRKSNYGTKYDELIPAGNMAIRKDYFLETGGFNNTMQTGEDDYLLKKFRRKGYKTISNHKIHSVHLGNAKNLLEYFKKETWYGLGMLGTLHLSKIDKPVIATIVFFLLLMLSCLLLIYYFVARDSYLLLSAFGASLLALLIPILAAIDRIYRKDRKGIFLYVVLIFIVFFLARLNSLLYLYKIRRK